MSMTQPSAVLKSESLLQQLTQLQAFVKASVQEGTAVHEVEQGIWTRVLHMGQQCLQQFFDLYGNGDQGETVILPRGEQCQRLPELHSRRYVSIFGVFSLPRTVYGSREGQQIQFVPLDNRLQLPASDFSYLLQDWDQSLCVEQAFGQVRSTVARILNLQQPVDSLEHMNRDMAEAVEPFRLTRPRPAPVEEGELFVATADGKGVVMRREADEPAPAAHRTKGQKASQKRMATLGAVYSVDRYVRTPEEVVAALFRDPDTTPAPRPQACGKRVWASLPNKDEPQKCSGAPAVYLWMLWELAVRNPGQTKETVQLYDGQEALWDTAQEYLPAKNSTGVLDLLHVTPRVWQAAHLFHPEGSDAAEAFARERILKSLAGSGPGRNSRLARLRDPTGTDGVEEKNAGPSVWLFGEKLGADALRPVPRQGVSDRQRRDRGSLSSPGEGSHGTRRDALDAGGAQAMLEVRSVYVCDEWEAFQAFRIARETRQLYPYRETVEGPAFMMAA